MRRANDKSLDAAKRTKAAARRERKLAGERHRTDKETDATLELSAYHRDDAYRTAIREEISLEMTMKELKSIEADWCELWAEIDNQKHSEDSDWEEYWAMDKGERDRLHRRAQASALATDEKYSAFCEYKRQVSDALGRVRDANRRRWLGSGL